MAKFPTFPTLFDEVLTLQASNLNRWGYLKPNHKGWYKITWYSNGNEIGAITIFVNTTKMSTPYVQLNYKHGDTPIDYRVYLDKVPSNLGNGFVWYFICPSTNKRCRKLYCVDGYFLHREAFNGCMYSKQIQSKKLRLIEKVYGAYFDNEKYRAELYKKHFKTHYKGKPTKRYLRLMKLIEQSDNIDYGDIERLISLGF